MKKFIVLVAACALSACTTPSQSVGEQHLDMHEGFHKSAFEAPVRTLGAGERAPSSADPTPRWQNGSMAVNVGPGGGTTSQIVTIQQVQDYDTMVNQDSTCYDNTGVQWVQKTWLEYTNCGAGNGKSPLWNDYYNASKDQKVAKLNAAILGVGNVSAKGLVAAGTFDHGKPKSWDEFARMIRTAEANSVVPKGTSTLVLIDNGARNMTNLGYTDATSCTAVSHTESVPVPVTTAYACQVQVPGVAQRVLNVIQQNVRLNVQGSVLQSFEQDRIAVQLGYDGRNISVLNPEGGPYNEYSVSQSTPPGSNNTTVTFTARQRNLVDLPSDLVQVAKIVPMGSQKVDFQLAINLAKYQPSQPGDQVMLSYYVTSCQVVKGWFGGDSGHCATFRPNWTNSARVDGIPLSAVNHIAINAPHTQNMKVVYQISRRSSRFYDSQPMTEQTTNETRGNP